MTIQHLARTSLLGVLLAGGAMSYLMTPPPAASQVKRGESAAAASDGLRGSEPSLKVSGDDISPEQRARVEQKIKDYEARYGTLGPKRVDGAAATAALTSPQPYPFHPQAGTLWQDLFISNFADLDASGGVLDWDCSNYTYDGHKGHDAGIGSFKRQAIGVPVFAALDGVVVDAHDGEPDMNTTWANQPANYVVLDHGNTHYTWYWHLKRDSVAVSVNQVVKAGTQLGLTASSGHSTGPHLHFESRYQGTWFEPYAGPCRAGASNWVSQTPIRRGTYVRDFVISPSGFAGSAGLPYDEAARTGTFLSGQRTVYFRVDGGELPAASTYRVRFVRPDGATSLDYPGAFNNNSATRGWYYWFSFNWNLSPAGNWRLLLDVNGVTLVDAPFKVVDTEAEITNRPPNAVVGVAFDPATPTADDVIFCRVQTSPITEDPDYDLVRYRYQWRRNGVVIRDRVSAALSDAIPKGSYQAGDTLSCKVTPSDGAVWGPSATTSFPNCGSTITPTAKSFAPAGGAGSVSLTTGSGCAWTAQSNVSWITIASGGASGTGSKTIDYTVAANTGAAARTGTLTIAGKTFTVKQSSLPGLSVGDVTVTEANTTAVTAVFTVKLSRASAEAVTVNYATANGTALAPADYTALPLTQLTFAPGETTKTVEVQVKGDLRDEAAETFRLRLSAPAKAVLTDGEGVCNIADDDPPPSITIGNRTVTEPDSGTVSAVFAVRLSAASGKTVTVKYATGGGVSGAVATAGSDYTAVPLTTLTFSPGQLTKTVTVQVQGDLAKEANETFFVNLSGATNATVADGQGQGTILNDD